MVKMPMQPVERDDQNVTRFVPNRIVQELLRTSTHDLNSIGAMGFTNQEREQFSQLDGYSVSGFCGLSYVSDEVAEDAMSLSDKFLETEKKKDEVDLETLPPFGANRRCIKCGNNTQWIKYVSEQPYMPYMKVICEVCGFAWKEKSLDAE